MVHGVAGFVRGAVVFALLVLGAGGCQREEPLPVLVTVPDFSLTDQHGRALQPAALRGAPWVASFIFTRCPSSCPMLTSQMGNLQRRLGDDAERIPMVSFSVDPEHDTPEVLARYAAEHGVRGRWYFLTGDLEDVRRAVVEGFRVRMGEREQVRGDVYDIMHAQHFILVDGRGRIRGYYPSDGEGIERLERDARRLLEGDADS